LYCLYIKKNHKDNCHQPTMDTRVAAVLMVLAVAAIAEAADCPNGWTFYSGSCYALLVRDAASWYEARVACDVIGGRLAEIADANHNTFVASHIKTHGTSSAWIGLEDLLVEGAFVWSSDASTPAYTHFHHGQPDDNAHAADCVYMRSDGDWYDGDCHSLHTPLCQQTARSTEGEIVG